MTIPQAKVCIRLAAIVGLGFCVPWLLVQTASLVSFLLLMSGWAWSQAISVSTVHRLLWLAVLVIPIGVCIDALRRDAWYARIIGRSAP
jgi:hypothetical protein